MKRLTLAALLLATTALHANELNTVVDGVTIIVDPATNKMKVVTGIGPGQLRDAAAAITAEQAAAAAAAAAATVASTAQSAAAAAASAASSAASTASAANTAAVAAATAVNTRVQFRGTWAASTAYAANDAVSEAGALYIAPTAFTSGTSFNASNWTLLLAASTGGGGESTATSYPVTSRPIVQSDSGHKLVTGDNANAPYGLSSMTTGSTVDIFQGGAGYPVLTPASGITLQNIGSNNSTNGPASFITLTWTSPTTISVSGVTTLQSLPAVYNYLTSDKLGSLAYWKSLATQSYDSGDWATALTNLTPGPPALPSPIPSFVNGSPLESGTGNGGVPASCASTYPSAQLSALNNELEVYPSGDAIKCLGAAWNPYSVLPGNVLRITASKLTPAQASIAQQVNTGSTSHSPSWLSGYLQTTPNSQLGGIFAAVFRTDPVPGAWPAFWTGWNNGWNNGPEIDCHEGAGNFPDRNYTSMHQGSAGTYAQVSSSPGLIGTFHECALVWNKDVTIYYWDGLEVARTPTLSVNWVPQHMLVNLAIAGADDFPGAPNSLTPSSFNMDVKSMKAWTLPAGTNLNTQYTGPALPIHSTTPATTFAAGFGIGGQPGAISQVLIPGTAFPPSPSTFRVWMKARFGYGGGYLIDMANPIGGGLSGGFNIHETNLVSGVTNALITEGGTYGSGGSCTDTGDINDGQFHEVQVEVDANNALSFWVDGRFVCGPFGRFLLSGDNLLSLGYSNGYYGFSSFRTYQGLKTPPGQNYTPVAAVDPHTDPTMIAYDDLAAPDSTAPITSPGFLDVPASPASAFVSGLTTTTATINWTAPTAGAAPTGYYVSGFGNTLYPATPLATSLQVTGLTAGTTYTLYVADYAPGGGNSLPVTFTTMSPPSPPPPTNGVTTAPPTNGLLGYYRFAESGTTALDSSGANNPGTLVGNPTRGTLNSIPVLTFGGNDQWVSLPQAASFPANGPVSVIGWFDRNTAGQHGAVFKVGAANDGFSIGVGRGGSNPGLEFSGDTLLAAYDNVRWIVGPTISSGTHCFAMTVDANKNPTLYLDGAQVYTDALSGMAALGSTGTPVAQIGGYIAGAGTVDRTFTGSTWKTAVYNRVLTSGEVPAYCASGGI